MFPRLHIFGLFAISTESVLLSCGVLAALATAGRLARAARLGPDRVWNAAVLALVSLWCGERLLVFASAWRSFLAHPLWMAGLFSVRDPRLFYAGAAVAIAVCAAYLRAVRVPLERAADALLPAGGVLLAFAEAGYFAGGAEPGRVTSARWGVVCTSRLARTLYATPLSVPLVPVAAYACAGYGLLALIAALMTMRGRPSAGFLLLSAGLLTVLLGQAQLRWAGEPMLAGVFTWGQGAGIVSVLAGAGLLLLRA